MEVLGTAQEIEHREIARRIGSTSPAQIFQGLVAEGGYLEKQHALYEEGDHAEYLYLLGEGRVRLVRRHSSRELTLCYVEPGQFLGDEGLFQLPYSGSAIAVSPIEYLRVRWVDVARQLTLEAPLVSQVLATAIQRRRLVEDRLHSVFTQSVEARVASFILNAAEAHGESHPAGIRIRERYTHAEIAAYVGATRETVTLVIGDLRRAGLLQSDRRNLVVRLHDQLRELARDGQ